MGKKIVERNGKEYVVKTDSIFGIEYETTKEELYEKTLSPEKETRSGEKVEVNDKSFFSSPNVRGPGSVGGQKGTFETRSGDKGSQFYPDESRKSSGSSYESSGSGDGGRDYGGGGGSIEDERGCIIRTLVLSFLVGAIIWSYREPKGFTNIFKNDMHPPKQEYIKREIPAKPKEIKLYNPLQQEKNIPKEQSSKLEELAKKSKASENKSSPPENNKQIKTYKESLSWSENEVVRKSRINESKVSSLQENNKQIKTYEDASKIYESLSSNSDFSKSTPKGSRPVVYDNRDENNNVISQRREYVNKEKLKESTVREIGITYPKTGNYYVIDKNKYPEFYTKIDKNKNGLISLDEQGRIQKKFNKITKKYSEGDIESIVKDFTKK